MSAGHKAIAELRIADCGLKRAGDTQVAVGGGDADVIHQRIEPDVGDKILVEGQGNAPVQTRRRPGDAQVFQLVVFQEAEHLVAAVIGLDE